MWKGHVPHIQFHRAVHPRASQGNFLEAAFVGSRHMKKVAGSEEYEDAHICAHIHSHVHTHSPVHTPLQEQHRNITRTRNCTNSHHTHGRAPVEQHSQSATAFGIRHNMKKVSQDVTPFLAADCNFILIQAHSSSRMRKIFVDWWPPLTAVTKYPVLG